MRPELGDGELHDDPGLMHEAGPSAGPKKQIVILVVCLVAVLVLGAAGWKALQPPGGAWLHSLDEGLDVDSSELSIPVNTTASPHPRVSLTLSALSRSDEIVLLMFGDRKREVYEAAKQTANGYPVFHLLRQKRAPVYVYWAP
jgi:6-phosphogluconolactonase